MGRDGSGTKQASATRMKSPSPLNALLAGKNDRPRSFRVNRKFDI